MKTLFLYIVDQENAPVLAGLTAVEWLVRGAGNAPYRVIREGEAVTPPSSDYFALLYPDTPLVTAEYLLDLMGEMDRRGISGLEIGGGMLVRTAAYREGYRPKRRANAPEVTRMASVADEMRVEKIFYRRIAERCARNGAIIIDLDAVRIDALSEVERGAIVEPYVKIIRSRVECGARIGSFSEISGSRIGQGAAVRHSIVTDSTVGAQTTIGPFAYLRAGTRVGAGCRIGDYVEVKNSTLADGVKAAHLAYVGDATVGERTNVGCGTVFCNYDGRAKHRTTVGRSVFIGANSNLVAPLTIGDDAYIAAATTVTEDVPVGAFVIGRVRASEKERK